MILIFRFNLAPFLGAMQLWIHILEHLVAVAILSTAWANRIGVLDCLSTATNIRRSPP